MKSNQNYDVVIIGAGHNGLTCAGYLARAGLQVGLVERRHIAGGAAITEEFHPGFQNSICSYAVSLLNPKVIKDLELNKYGMEIQAREFTALVLGENNKYLFASADYSGFIGQLRQFSAKDAENYDEFQTVLQAVADVLRDLVLVTPPNIGGGLGDLWRAGMLANRVRKLSPELQRETIKLFTMSVADYLEQWFEGELLMALESYVALVGNMQSVYAGGSAYVLLHHVFGEVNGNKGRWGHVKGGMGGITQAMAKSAEAHGAEIHLNAPVKQVLIENGKAAGVETEDGQVFRAKAVAANVNPKLLFQRLVAQDVLSEDFKKQIENYRCVSGTFRMNVALKELPRFTCVADKDDYENYLSGSIFVANSMRYNEMAWQDAMNLGWSRKPIIQMMIPSIYDDSLAPEGQHVASMFCQHFNPNLPDGRNWNDVR